MKTWKKNMVAAAVLVTVCAGIYLNWLYTDAEQTAYIFETLLGDDLAERKDFIRKNGKFYLKDADI